MARVGPLGGLARGTPLVLFTKPCGIGNVALLGDVVLTGVRPGRARGLAEGAVLEGALRRKVGLSGGREGLSLAAGREEATLRHL